MPLLTIPYKPFEHQVVMHTDPQRFKVIVGGRRAGKSKSAFQEVLKHALSNPNSLCWWVAPTYSEAREIGFEEFKRYEELLGPAVVNVHTSLMRVEFSNGSMVYFKGADRKDSLRGRGLDYLVIDEAAFIERDIWKKVLRPALSDKHGKALIISTPNGRNWFYTLYAVAKGRVREGHLTWKTYHWPSYVNPLIAGDEIHDAKEELADSDFRQEYLAEFVTRSGQVYDEFDDDNIIDKFDIDKDRYYFYLGADFGYANPACIVFMAVDTLTNKVYQFDEIYQARMSMQLMLDKIKQKLDEHGLSPRDVRAVYTDPAGNAEEITSGISPVDFLRKTFTVINKGTKIAPGLQLVRSFIKNANENRRFFIHKRCDETIRSFYGYTYKPVTRGNEDLVHEEPDKDGLHDHACDAVRYFFVNTFDHAKWLTDHVEQFDYTAKKDKQTVIKRCYECKRPFPSKTPKDKPPFLCETCLQAKE
jgi:PBSX family phage terminase large subunit